MNSTNKSKERRAGKESERRCLVTGERLSPDAMLRFIVTPDGQLMPDFSRRLPGRGLWLTAEAAIVRCALVKKLFSKAARQQVTVDPALPEQLAKMARARFLDQLGLARRAGAVVSGFEAVRTAVARHQAKLLIAAADGSDHTQRRLKMAAGETVVCIGCFQAAELGQALGRDIAVHLTVTDQRWAERLSQRAALALSLEQGGVA